MENHPHEHVEGVEPHDHANMEICGAYADVWEYLGKPEGWEGCSLAPNHKGDHSDA